jgi:hypothetical protein
MQRGRPLTSTPEEYSFSSYPGYARKSKRVPWVVYDEHHRYWQRLNGGKDPGTAYRKYVKAGLVSPTDASVDRLKDWVDGTEDFLRRVLPLAANDDAEKFERQIRRSSVITVDDVIESTAKEYGVRLLSILVSEAVRVDATWWRTSVAVSHPQHLPNYQSVLAWGILTVRRIW